MKRNIYSRKERIAVKHFRRLTAVLLTALIICALALPALAGGGTRTTTVLFTHDLHSHFLPMPAEGGGESGGYARLSSALAAQRQKHPDALTLDGGDFSIGSLIQTLYTDQGAELITMGALGYDAAAIGNHEFDHTGAGFAKMLSSVHEYALTAGGDVPLPALVQANYSPAPDNPDRGAIAQAMADYGVADGIILERGGVKYGIFGLMGTDSDDCAPTSGFVLEDPAQAAARCVSALKDSGAEFIICLSHSGTDNGKGEDYELARAVSGIDLIVSGHTHTTLRQPIVVNGTYIVSAGPYCRNLGSITLRWDSQGNKTLAEYELIPIDETLPDDPDIAALVEGWKEQVGRTYLSAYGLTYDQVLTTSGFELLTPESGVQEGNALGELVADAFLWAVENLEAGAPDVDTVAVTADGVLRADLTPGEITTSMAFDVLSMGVGSDGTSGFPLVAVYLTGKELKAACEVDASVTPIMNAAQLYMSGIAYSFNTNRMFFNRVTEAHLAEAPFTNNFQGQGLAEIEDGRLYRVVTGMYSAQMLGTVKNKSMGLLSLEPKMADGSPVTSYEDCILRDKDGSEIKEWYALAAYLKSFGAEGIPRSYAAPDGRKHVISSWNPIELLKNPNWITLAVLGVVALAAAVLVFLVYRLVFRRGRKRRGYRSYRG